VPEAGVTGHFNFTFSGQNTRNQHLSASCIYSIPAQRAESDSDPLGLTPLVRGNSAAFVAVESHTGSTVEKWAANMEKDSEGYRPVPYYP
jgi:hypothetical protein